jgi:hypothetical protein
VYAGSANSYACNAVQDGNLGAEDREQKGIGWGASVVPGSGGIAQLPEEEGVPDPTGPQVIDSKGWQAHSISLGRWKLGIVGRMGENWPTQGSLFFLSIFFTFYSSILFSVLNFKLVNLQIQIFIQACSYKTKFQHELFIYLLINYFNSLN